MNNQETKHDKIILGDEYDEILIDTTKEVLKELGGQMMSKERGMAGSQEIDTMTVDINGSLVTIETETYVGLSISGEKGLVTRIASLIRVRLGK